MIKENQKEKTECCSDYVFKRGHHHNCHGYNNSHPIYGLGIIGALFYFLQNTTSFSIIMVGIGKSIFWPAILMFKLLTLLQM